MIYCHIWAYRIVDVDATFDLSPLDEALRCSLCWSSEDAAGERAAGAVEARGCSGVISVHSGQ